ncbi:unnamed protein product [Cochlearia groenlandica]
MSSRLKGFQKNKDLKIIIIGDSGVGKTSLINRYIDKDFKKVYKNTYGFDYKTKELSIGDEGVTLNIWDTAGQERFKSITHNFYRDADCCVLVYDVNVLQTFKSLDKWHDEFIKEVNPSTSGKFPFVLVGNKIDVKEGHSRVVPKKKAKEWCELNGKINYFETSTKEDINVDEAFLMIAKKALSNENHIDEGERYNGESATQPKFATRSRCAC